MYMDCTTYVVKTEVLIRCAVTTQPVCAFVFAYVKKQIFFKTLLITDCRPIIFFKDTKICYGTDCFSRLQKMARGLKFRI